MTPQEHYTRAESLLAEGVKVVTRIGSLAELRRSGSTRPVDRRDYTEQMDELGKKAMGIWAQAQVHATLATTPIQQVQVEVLDSVSVEVVNAGDLR